MYCICQSALVTFVKLTSCRSAEKKEVDEVSGTLNARLETSQGKRSSQADVPGFMSPNLAADEEDAGPYVLHLLCLHPCNVNCRVGPQRK